MSVPTRTEEFDYDVLKDASLAKELQNSAIRFVAVHGEAQEKIIEAGKVLKHAHDKLAGAGRDGAFLPWVRAELPCSKQTAYNYINAYEAFGKCPTVGHFDTAAMYLLSSDSCPEDAAKEAVKLSKKGKHITLDVAKELKSKHTTPQEPVSEPEPQADVSPTPPQQSAPGEATGDEGGDSEPLEGEIVGGEFDNLPQQDHISDPDPYRVATLELKAAAKHISAKHHLDDDQVLSLFESAAAELEREWDEGDSYEP